MKQLINGIALIYAILITGCTSMSAIQPVTRENLSDDDNFVVLSTASDRRLAIVNVVSKKTCMEPPPDATMNVSASLAATLTAKSLESGGVGPEGALAYTDNLAKALAHVQQPSQGIILYRNIASSLCNLYVNGAIVDKEYAKLLTDVMGETIRLTNKELELTEGKIGPNTALSGDGNSSANSTGQLNSSAGTAAKAAATSATATAGVDPKKAEQVGAAAEKATNSSIHPNASTEEKANAAGTATSAAVTAATKNPKLGEDAGKAAKNAILNEQDKENQELDKRIKSIQNQLEKL